MAIIYAGCTQGSVTLPEIEIKRNKMWLKENTKK